MQPPAAAIVTVKHHGNSRQGDPVVAAVAAVLEGGYLVELLLALVWVLALVAVATATTSSTFRSLIAPVGRGTKPAAFCIAVTTMMIPQLVVLVLVLVLELVTGLPRWLEG